MNGISIIIPALNEADNLPRLFDYLKANSSRKIIKEIIVVDGGSTDNTLQIVKEQNDIVLLQSEKGRAIQMNTGAKKAKGSILYFLHADSFPPANFDELILSVTADGGCFRLKFDQPNSIWLKIAPWFTQFGSFLFRGGDQSLFINAKVFEELGGYDERYEVYEDIEFVNTFKEEFEFVILKQFLTTSSRRFRENGTFRLYIHFLIVHVKAWLGQSPESLTKYYRKHIK